MNHFENENEDESYHNKNEIMTSTEYETLPNRNDSQNDNENDDTRSNRESEVLDDDKIRFKWKKIILNQKVILMMKPMKMKHR